MTKLSHILTRSFGTVSGTNTKPAAATWDGMVVCADMSWAHKGKSEQQRVAARLFDIDVARNKNPIKMVVAGPASKEAAHQASTTTAHERHSNMLLVYRYCCS